MKRKWEKDDNGLFVTYCKGCGIKKLTKKRPYNNTLCKDCGRDAAVETLTKSRKFLYTKERNNKISTKKKEYWQNKDKDTRSNLMKRWMSDYIGSDKHLQTAKENQKKATKAALKVKVSKPEKELAEFLNDLDVNFVSQFYVDRYPFDFYIPETNTLVELDGEFYHPLTEQDCIYDLQKHNYKRDKLKNKVAETNGFNLVRIRI